MVNILLDGKAVSAPAGTTILKAAGLAGVDIPHFCFHPAFEPEGSCRMCLVEVEGVPKLELACSAVVKEGMKVLTSSPAVVRARREVLEFLLAEHPLDCPICDKAGECRLQDYYELHGLHGGRFLEPKEKKAKTLRIGKSLILDRERCVLCTRCVRFLRKMTGTGELGVFERGIRSEIGILEDAAIENNYSGNLVDLCPVGAITDSEFRFRTRAWFLETRRTLCPLCGRGCNIQVDSVDGYPLQKGERRFYRIRPAENPEVNGYWICDIGRYGLKDVLTGRRFRIRGNPGREEQEKNIGWDQAVKTLAKKIQSLFKSGKRGRIAVVLSGFLTNEELRLCRTLFVDALEVQKVFFADPKDAESDGILLTKDRVPNRRGAMDSGFRPALPDLGAVAASTDILFLFGDHLADNFAPDVLLPALGKIGTKILFSSRKGPLDSQSDMIFPAAIPFEKSGSYTNVDGRLQPFEAAWSPPGETRSEGEFFEHLAEALGVKLG